MAKAINENGFTVALQALADAMTLVKADLKALDWAERASALKPTEAQIVKLCGIIGPKWQAQRVADFKLAVAHADLIKPARDIVADWDKAEKHRGLNASHVTAALAELAKQTPTASVPAVLSSKFRVMTAAEETAAKAESIAKALKDFTADATAEELAAINRIEKMAVRLRAAALAPEAAAA